MDARLSLLVLSALLGCSVGQLSCAAPGNYDVTDLTKAALWTVTTTGRCPFDVNSNASCTFKMSFCQPMPEHDDCLGSSVCVTYYNGTEAKSLSLGKSQTDPFALNDLGFQATYGNGSAYGNCASGLSSKISFECNRSALWIPKTQGESVAPEPISFSYNFARCTYNLWFEYAGACPSSASVVSSSLLLILLSVLKVCV